jgi:hypothetical protein
MERRRSNIDSFFGSRRQDLSRTGIELIDSPRRVYWGEQVLPNRLTHITNQGSNHAR